LPPHTPKITHLHHPSGELYESYCRFAESHPEASWFQSDHFFRFLSLWPEAYPVLLVAMKEEALPDPGQRYAGKGERRARRGELGEASWELREEDRKEGGMRDEMEDGEGKTREQQGGPVVGSLLVVVIQNPVPAAINFFPLSGLWQRFTTRAVVYGGPLLASGTKLEKELTLKALLKALKEKIDKKVLFTEFRNFYDMEDHKKVFYENRYTWEQHMNLLLQVKDRTSLWKNLSQSRRRQVRKSLQHGAEIIHNPTPDQVDQFYDILKTLYNKKVRKPLPSRTFFHALNPHSAHYTVPPFRHHPETPTTQQSQQMPQATSNPKPQTSNPFTTILIQHNNIIIGGIACPILPGRAMYEWYVCGLDREYRDRQVYPSVLATWAALEYAAENGIPQFDFMGLGKPEEEYGVRDFKARFGGEWVNHGRFLTINSSRSYHIANLLYRLKKLMG